MDSGLSTKNMSKLYIFLIAGLLVFRSGELTAQAPHGPWSLEECVTYAIGHNPDMKASELNLEADKANQVQAKMNRLPTGSIGVSHGVNAGRSIDPFTNQPVTQQFQTTDAGLNAGLNLFSGLQVQNLIRQMNLSFKASQQDLQQTQNTVSLNVALAYLAILQNEEMLEIAQQQVSTSKSQLARADKLVAVGAMAQSTLADLKVQAGNDELERINAVDNLATAKLQLMQLMNLPAVPNFQIQRLSVQGLVETGYDKSAEEVYAIAEKIQPGIIGADLRVKSAQRGVQAVRGALYPSLSLYGYIGSNYSSAVPTTQFVADGTGFTTEEVASTTQYILVNGIRQPIYTTETSPNGQMQDFFYFDQLNFNLRNSFGVSLSIPILNNWQMRTRISNATIVRKRAELLAETSRIQLRQDIEQAYNNLAAAQTRFETAKSQSEATEVAYQAAQKRFENGSVHFVDLNLAKTNYDRAQLNLVRFKYDFAFRKKILDFYINQPLTF